MGNLYPNGDISRTYEIESDTGRIWLDLKCNRYMQKGLCLVLSDGIDEMNRFWSIYHFNNTTLKFNREYNRECTRESLDVDIFGSKEDVEGAKVELEKILNTELR